MANMSHSSKDRKGGHLMAFYLGRNGVVYATPYQKSFAKRCDRRKMRRDHRRITAEAFRQYLDEQEDILQEILEDYERAYGPNGENYPFYDDDDWLDESDREHDIASYEDDEVRRRIVTSYGDDLDVDYYNPESADWGRY